MHKSQQEQCRSLLRLRWWTPAEHTCPPGLMGGAGRLAGRPTADLKLCPQRHAPSTQAPCADGSPWARVRWQWCVGTLFLMSVGVGSIFFFLREGSMLISEHLKNMTVSRKKSNWPQFYNAETTTVNSSVFLSSFFPMCLSFFLLLYYFYLLLYYWKLNVFILLILCPNTGNSCLFT